MRTDINFMELSAAQGWPQESSQHLLIDWETGEGALILQEGFTEGLYLSPVVETPLFENLVVCWNADTPEGSSLEVSARVYLPGRKQWSPWGSWGRWSPYAERRNRSGTYPDEDPLIRMDCDILEPCGEAASALQICCELRRERPDVKIALRRLTIALRNRKLPEIPSRKENGPAIPQKWILNTPACSQMIRDPEIANCICNPTTMTVLLSERGTQVLPEVMALSCVDLIEGFGNWSYAAAAVGMYGYKAWARFLDYEGLKTEIAAGRSVGVSVHYAKSPEEATQRGLPYVEGAPCTTPGHILAVRGYASENGREYVYVSDSAAESDAEALRRYPAEQFLEAWSGRLCYIIGQKEKGAGFGVPEFQEITLCRTNSGRYRLLYEGEPVLVTPQWLQEKKSVPGRMTLMLQQVGNSQGPMEANQCFLYPEPDTDSSIEIPEGEWNVYLISNTGLRLKGRKR